jgi:hypothetical protein
LATSNPKNKEKKIKLQSRSINKQSLPEKTQFDGNSYNQLCLSTYSVSPSQEKKTPHIHIQSNTSMHASELHNELSFTSKNQDKENRIP